jgi:hypothetical protein
LLNFPTKIKLSPFKALFAISLTAYVGHWLIPRRGKEKIILPLFIISVVDSVESCTESAIMNWRKSRRPRPNKEALSMKIESVVPGQTKC